MRTLLLTALLFVTGCVQSLHPFYTEEQLTFDKNLIGYWTDADGKNTFDIPELDANAEDKSYRVFYTDEHGKTGEFIVRLARVDKYLIADVTPAERRDDASGMYKGLLLPVRSFFLVEAGGESLKLRSMDYDWLKKELETRPDAIRHERVGNDRILLTAPSDKLQAFVLKHMETPGAFGEWTEFKRTPKPAK